MDISEKLDDLEVFYERRLKESRAELEMLPKGGITVSRLRNGYLRRISYTDPITKKYHRRKAKRKEGKRSVKKGSLFRIWLIEDI